MNWVALCYLPENQFPSTMEQMKEQCSKGFGPKKVASDVSTILGGVLAATDSCEIPRNEQQVSKLKR